MTTSDCISAEHFVQLYRSLPARRRAVLFLSDNYYLVTKKVFISRSPMDNFNYVYVHNDYDQTMLSLINVLRMNENEDTLAEEIGDYVFLCHYLTLYKDMYDILEKIISLKPRMNIYNSLEEILEEHRTNNSKMVYICTQLCRYMSKHISTFIA
jgi:hypothetical protein